MRHVARFGLGGLSLEWPGAHCAPASTEVSGKGLWTEIAAYELDKLLKMDMVPPAVERQLQGNMGAAQLWVEDVVDATDPTSPDAEQRAHWERQIVRMTDIRQPHWQPGEKPGKHAPR